MGRRLGFADEAFSWDEKTALRKVAAHLAWPGASADADLLESGGRQSLRIDGELPVQFGNTFPTTPDARVCLVPEVLGAKPFHFEAKTDPDYPLALISPATGKLVSSTFGQFNLKELKLTLNPADASARDLRSGELVRVFNKLGEVICSLDVNARTAPGVAVMPKTCFPKLTQKT